MKLNYTYQLLWLCQSLTRVSSTTSLQTTLRTYKLPGLAALTVRANGSVEVMAIGLRKADDANARLTTEDLYHLGSNTKSMTATLLAKIIETGNSSLTWNTTIPQALPHISEIHSGFTNVTLETLALHRSGISLDVLAKDRQLFLSFFNSSLSPVEGRASVARLFLQDAPDYPPNTAFKYSNVNYMLLGSIIDNLGVPWEARIQRELWKPLSMARCGLGPVPQSSPTAVDGPYGHNATAEGYVPISPFSTGLAADNPPTYGPAGTAHCSLEDYGKFLALHLSAAQGLNTSYLSPETLQYLQRPPGLPAGEDDSGGVYTPGWVFQPESRAYNGPSIGSSGSNTLNWVTAIVASGKEIAAAAFTNVGDDNANKACLDVASSLITGQLKLTEEAKPSAAISLFSNLSLAQNLALMFMALSFTYTLRL